jgi:hypothetical protein
MNSGNPADNAGTQGVASVENERAPVRYVARISRLSPLVSFAPSACYAHRSNAVADSVHR